MAREQGEEQHFLLLRHSHILRRFSLFCSFFSLVYLQCFFSYLVIFFRGFSSTSFVEREKKQQPRRRLQKPAFRTAIKSSVAALISFCLHTAFYLLLFSIISLPLPSALLLSLPHLQPLLRFTQFHIPFNILSTTEINKQPCPLINTALLTSALMDNLEVLHKQ